MRKSTVGKSAGRTPGKHELLNALLGKQIAVSKKIHWMLPPFAIIDLCAGDGRDTLESGSCSPKIIMKHAVYGHDQQNVKVVMIEKDPNTFDVLRNAYEDQDCQIINGDSSTDEVVEEVKSVLFDVGFKSPVFIHHDPNAVTNWCLRGEYLELSNYVTTMVTMGCNVGGLKRLSLEERLVWFDNFNLLQSQVKSTRGRLDLCLIALIHDCSNWAYAVSVPAKWRDSTTKTIHAAFKSWTNGIELEWMGVDSQKFEDLQTRLFLTKDEYKQLGSLS